MNTTPHLAIRLMLLLALGCAVGCGNEFVSFETPSGGGDTTTTTTGGHGGSGASAIGGSGGPGGGGSVACEAGETMVLSEQHLGVASALVAADLDGDGDLDLAAADDTAGTRLFRNDAADGMTVTGPPLGDAWTLDLAAADVDGDGDLDLVEANYSGETNAIWLNDGAMGFTKSAISVGAGESTYAITVGDVDHDGLTDVLTVNEATQGLRLRFGTGNGNFGAYDLVAAPPSGSYHAAALGDLDGDGDLDLVAGGATVPVVVWRFDSSSFVQSSPMLSSGARALALVDLDGDGDLDIVAADGASLGSTWTNNGSGGFTIGMTLAFGAARRLAVADIDADGDPDVAIAAEGADSIWLNDGTGALVRRPEVVLDGAGAPSRAIALLDVDLDCDLDLATAGEDMIGIWRNQ